jgi:hypothetical protein
MHLPIQKMSDMPQGNNRIEVAASCLLECRSHGCTIFLTNGADSWHKLYGSTREALQEARILKLPSSTLDLLAGGDASSNEPAPICFIDLGKLGELGFHKGREMLSRPVP